MKVKAGRFILVFVSFNVLFLALYVFTSNLSARIFMEDEAGFVWNAQIQNPDKPSSEAVVRESLLSFSLPVIGSEGATSVETTQIIFDHSPEAERRELMTEIEENELSVQEVLLHVDSSQEALSVDSSQEVLSLSEPSLAAVEESLSVSEALVSAIEEELSEPVVEVGKNWLELWEEAEEVISLSHIIHNPFDQHYMPTVYVKRTADGFVVRLQKSAARNLQGDFLSQDHLELWLQDAEIRPPENYGQISYQFGIGLGEKPWLKEFLGTKPALNLEITRTEIDDFIELQISGLQKSAYEWNMVYSGAFFQQEWVQGYLLSAAENFRWGNPEGLLR